MEEEEEEGDDNNNELFLRRRSSFLTPEQMHDLEPENHLGSEGYGSIRRVVYQGTKTVVKEFLDPTALHVYC